jgi:hypothetical protein
MPEIADIDDASAIFPPLTTNEGRVLEVLASASTGELSAETIAERTGLTVKRAERALSSLRSRRPPLVDATSSDRVAHPWQPPTRYSVPPAIRLGL